MSKKDLSNIFQLIVNEDKNAKKNLLNWMNEQTKLIAESSCESPEDVKDTKDGINYEEEHVLPEAEQTVDDIADSQADQDLEDGDFDLGESPSKPSDPSIAADVATGDLDPYEVNYQFTDIQKDLERLKKEFDKISGNADTDNEDSTAEDITGSDNPNDLPESITEDEESSEENKDESSEESKESEEKSDKEPTEDDLAESLFSDNDFAELIEACDLTDAVAPVKNNDGEETGKGGKISQNDESPISGCNDAAKRSESAKPIEVKSDNNDSFAREKAPKVTDVKLGNVRNRPDVTEVPKGGDPKAELNNKGNGFGKENAASPIPGKKG